MITQVQIFHFEDREVRTVMVDEEICWVASDICNILGIVNNRQAVEDLAEDEKLLYPLHTAGQHRNVLLVNEPGLYRLIFKSRKEEAERVKHWAFHEVLPSIRKTGSYSLQGLGTLDYLDQVIEKQREILRGYRKVKHQERKRLGLVVPRIPQPTDIPPQDLLLNFLKAQPVPVTIREIARHAPMGIRRLKAEDIRVLLIEMQAADLVSVKTQGKAVGYALTK